MTAEASARPPVWARLKKRMTAVRKWSFRHPVMGVALLACTLALVYWAFIASDRYVSEAHVIIQRTDVGSGQTVDFASLLGNPGGASRVEQLVLRDYLLSPDMLRKLDQKLQLRAHYSDTRHDILSRLWSASAPQELFHRYAQRRIHVEFDDYAGVLIIRCEAYDPVTARDISRMIVAEGERYMNELLHRLARDQVAFLEKQVSRQAESARLARQRLLDFQNKHGMVSPQSTVENVSAMVNRLEAQLIELQNKRAVLGSYLASDSANVVELDAQIAATRKQIAGEKGRLTAPGGRALNRTMEEFQRLEMEAGFAQDIYKSALLALEQGRIEATRTLKMVSIVQAPTLPEYPQEPRRLYNIVLCLLVTLILAGIVQLLLAIIRDHRD